MKLTHLLLLLTTTFASTGALALGQDIDGFPPPLPEADLVLRNGTIVTLDPLQPQAQAMAVRGGRIQALGNDEAISGYIGDDTRVLNLHGAFATPGFIEGHGHLMGTGQNLMSLDVGKAANWAAIVALVKQAVADSAPGEWIVGHGWHQAKWDKVPQPNVNGLPLPSQLDAISPDNPVMLIHASGHGLYANAAALKAAGIDKTTVDPVGGTIVRDADGNAIGMLRDTAANPVHAAHQRFVEQLSPQQRAANRKQALQLAIKNLVSQGITTFVDMGAGFETIDWLKDQASRGLPMRLYINVRGESIDSLDKRLGDYKTLELAEHGFAVRGIGEILTDGALGTRSAWMIEPYHDAPELSGKSVMPMSQVAQIAKIAAREGFQISVHAIGDRANRETLDLMESIFARDPEAHKLRWRIEHAQNLTAEDLPRFAELGVIASMQSIHACSDAPMVVPRLGQQRAKAEAYPWQSLIASGAIVLEGTDTPVEGPNPIANFYCGVTRAYHKGKDRLFPEQVKARIEELRSYTWNNAYAIFAEDLIGSLSPGKLADITVFSGNLLTLPDDQLLQTRVLYTIVGGDIVYQRPGAEDWRKGESFDPMPQFNHAE